MKKYNKRIESNPEIEALLNSLLKMANADAAILYKYIDESDIEGTEILDLLSKSPIILLNEKENKNKFFDDVIENTFPTQKLFLKEMIISYKNGELNLCDKEVKLALKKLQEKIKILRFCDISEEKPEKSRWNFDYNKRPPKYIVFSDDILQEEFRTKPIPFEGITAYFCRLQGKYLGNLATNVKPCSENPPSWVLSRDIINSTEGHRKIGDDSTVFNNYDSHHAAWVLLGESKIINENNINTNILNDKIIKNVIGCLRFEYYPNEDSKNNNISPEDQKKILEEKILSISSFSINDLIYYEIQSVFSKQKDFSYSELYRCLDPILNELMKIGMIIKNDIINNTNTIEKGNLKKIKEIHYNIEHLFYVLKRNTYYGDAILERINRFIEDLLDLLGLPKEIYFNIWKNLEKHEDLMLYDLEDYRDHLMHQFHVFIMGYIIIYNYKIANFQELTNKNYKKFIKSEDSGNSTDCFSKTDVLRIWALSSIFHDCGYAFEKLSDGFKSFTNKVMFSELNAIFKWDELLLDNPTIPVLLQNITNYFNICNHCNSCNSTDFCSQSFTNSDLYRILIKNSVLKNDHGVISAIILLQQYSNHSEKYSEVPNIESIIYIAALSIAIHNNQVYKDISKQGNPFICFELNPFSFLLTYCDTVQEWGRKKNSSTNKKYYSSPNLNKLEFSNKDNIFQIMLELFYPPDSNGLPPQKIYIKKKISSIVKVFIVKKGNNFCIKYNVRRNNNASFNEKFNDCSGDCSTFNKLSDKQSKSEF